MNDNTIHVVFCGKERCITTPAWQYDYGQVVVFDDITLDDAFEVHFSNTRDKGNASVHIGTNNQVNVPSAYLMTGLPVYGWIYGHPTNDSGETWYHFVIPVKARPAPDPQEAIPDEYTSTIRELMALLRDAASGAELSAEAAEAAEENALESAQNAAQAALEAVRAIEFNINEEEGTLEVTLP